jgi:hypothetical protein
MAVMRVLVAEHIKEWNVRYLFYFSVLGTEEEGKNGG